MNLDTLYMKIQILERFSESRNDQRIRRLIDTIQRTCKVCMYVRTYVRAHVCMYMCVCVCMYVYMHTYIYVFACPIRNACIRGAHFPGQIRTVHIRGASSVVKYTHRLTIRDLV